MTYRRLYFTSFILFLLIYLGTSCASSSGSSPSATSSTLAGSSLSTLETRQPTLSVSETQVGTGPVSLLTPTSGDPELPTQAPSTRDQVKSQYILTAVLDYTSHHLSVEEQIIYTNNAPDALIDLVLMIDTLYYPNTFHLIEISWENGDVADESTWGTGWLQVKLPEPLLPGENISLSLSYELFLPSPVPSPDTRPVPFGYTPRQINLVDWYPFVPPYIPGEGWQVNQAGFFGEHLVYEISDFQVNVRLADERPDIILVASSSGEEDGAWTRFRHTSARNFVWSASHEYQVMQTKVGDVTVSSYFFPYHSKAGETVLKVTAEALELFSSLYGAYPHKTLNVVEADFLDGMEYDGMYFLSNGFYNLYQGNPGEYLVAIAAHETAHQWFYAQVGNDQANEPWLDEALCTYQEKIYYENFYPEALDWWWAYRVNYYNPRGWVNGSIYNPEGYRSYRDAIYLNGAVFLDDLRNLIGDAPFFAFLQDYTTSLTDRIATGDDFFTILSRHTQADITVLVSEFFSPR